MLDLNSDELGEKGESRFREICADAKLVCNKADRDRTGWDFIVEFPFDNMKSTPLDSRSTPISCHVQVKTLLESSNSFSMRLSSAERLAKELKPSFIYIFKVNKGKQITEAFLVHLLDQRLAAILKRLRKEEARGTTAEKINQKAISMTLLDSERIEPNGSSLRAAIGLVSHGGIYAYAAMKKAQLEKIGFETVSYEGKMSLHLRDEEEIVDAFLGIKKEIPVSNFKIFQKRFGIKLPQGVHATGKITIEPHPFDQCIVSIYSDELSQPAVFNAEIFLPGIPNLPRNKMKALIKAPLFTITIEQKEDTSTYTFAWEVGGETQNTFDTWGHFWRMILTFAEGKGSIQIASAKLNTDICLPVQDIDIGITVDECKYWLTLCEQTAYLFKLAGLTSELKLSLADISSSSQEILVAYSILKSESPRLSFKTEINDTFERVRQERFIYARYFVVGEVSIAYYGVAKFSTAVDGDCIIWDSTEFSPGRIRSMSNLQTQFDSFLKTAQEIEGTQYVVRFNHDC